MKIGIIGAGFTGLAAAYKLTKLGHIVTIFEKDNNPGGLALGFKDKSWRWSIEKHYHHWFASDKYILKLAKEINYPVIINRSKTSVYLEGNSYQLDSPLHVLNFSKLTLSERIRMAATLAVLRYNPFWQPLEKVTIAQILPKVMGKNAYQKLWEPQLKSKFGEYANDISLVWFWARIKVRTPNLVYPKGGFLHFAQYLTKKIESKGTEFLFNTEIIQIASETGKVLITTKSDNDNTPKTLSFDKVIVTLPTFLFLKIAPQLPDTYRKKSQRLRGLGAINLILRLKKQFLKDGTYWLSICEPHSPIMAVVEHTNFMSKKYYNNEHIVYVGNYFPPNHPYFKLNAAQLLKAYYPFLKKINPDYQKSLINYYVFKTPFAQSIIYPNYSKLLPPFKTPLSNVYLANIQQVYPWDRGTNYAVELGEKIVDIMLSDP